MPLSPVNLCPIYRHNLNCTTQFRHFATETSLGWEGTQAPACNVLPRKTVLWHFCNMRRRCLHVCNSFNCRWICTAPLMSQK